jgi:hypothetical protein
VLLDMTMAWDLGPIADGFALRYRHHEWHL